jgi:CHAD domain-containing protein
MISRNPSEARKKYPDLLIGDRITVAGKKVFRFHYQKMVENEKGTKLGVDIEALHDMRVAIRRMRTAIGLFRNFYDPEFVMMLHKNLRKAGKSLGQVRDLDILIQMLDHDFNVGKPSTSSENAMFYHSLRNSWIEERVEAREKMLSYLSGKKYHRLKNLLAGFIQTTTYDKDDFEMSPPATQLLQEMASERFQNVAAFERIFPSPSLTQLHELRIAVKQLRYTIEFFRNILGEEADICITILKGIQDYFGDVNDNHVAINRLAKYADGVGSFFDAIQMEIDIFMCQLNSYIQQKKANLDAAVLSCSDVWNKFDEEGFFLTFKSALTTLN